MLVELTFEMTVFHFDMEHMHACKIWSRRWTSLLEMQIRKSLTQDW